VLAQCGYGSLRGIEELIIAGRITINRQPAEVGQKVGPDDQVRINGELVRLRFAPVRVRVLLYHKPAGEIVSRSDPEGRPTVFDKLPKLGHAKWIAVGRLDFNTEGLLLFTTSGELANRLMHPRYEVEREYAIRTVGTLTPEQERMLLEGVPLDDGPAQVLTLADGGGEGTNHWYKLTLPEGRNREVRRLFEALGVMVSRLTRTRYGIVSLPPQLKRGQTIELERAALDALLKAAGLNSDGRGSDQPGRGDPQGPTDVHDGQPVHAVSDDDAHEIAHDEVDGNRGTYGIPEPAEVSDEVDGNRAPPPPVAREARPPGGGSGRQKNAKNHQHRRSGAQQPRAQQSGAQQPGAQQPGAQQPGPQQPGAQQPRTQQPAHPSNKSGRRGRRGGRGGRGGQNGPGAGQQA
jgi:23S rRNA pseudouridine2605 synthase